MKIELTHDILAKKVGQKVSAEDKKQRKIEKFIHDSFERKAELDKEDMERIDPYLDKLLLTSEEILYIEENKERIKSKQRKLAVLGVSITLILIFLSVISFIYFEKAKKDKVTLNERKEESIKKKTEVIQKKEDLDKKIELLEEKEKEIAEKKKKIEEVKQKQKELQTEYSKSKEESEKRTKELADEEKKLNAGLEVLSKELYKIQKEEEEKKLAEAKKVLSREDGKPKEWSNYLGKMNWNSAMEKCKGLEENGLKDWRLPTVDEYKAIWIVDSKLVEKWRNEGWVYWTKDELLKDDGNSSESAYYFLINYGYGLGYRKDADTHVRCIR